MLKFAPYILKTLWRHRTRTVLTVSGSAVALFVFCFVGAIQVGLDNLQNQHEASRSLIVFQANKFCPATSHLPQDYDARIRKLPGVRDVVPVEVFTNNCRASLDVVVFYGVPPAKLPAVRDFKLLDGSWSEFEKHQDAAVVGRAVSRRRNIKSGDRFTIGGVTVNAAGIFTSGNVAEENYIYTHLDFLQRRHGKSRAGTVTQFEVLLDDRSSADQMISQVDELFASGPIETDTRTKGVFQAASLADLAELVEMAHYLGLACVGLIIILVATTTLMAVQDRAAEHAVLQTLGFSGGRIFFLVLAESIVLSAVGGLIGVTMSMLILSWGGFAMGAEAVTIAFTPSVSLAMNGLLVAFATGLVAGIIPAWQAARAEIVPALRHV